MKSLMELGVESYITPSDKEKGDSLVYIISPDRRSDHFKNCKEESYLTTLVRTLAKDIKVKSASNKNNISSLGIETGYASNEYVNNQYIPKLESTVQNMIDKLEEKKKRQENERIDSIRVFAWGGLGAGLFSYLGIVIYSTIKYKSMNPHGFDFAKMTGGFLGPNIYIGMALAGFGLAFGIYAHRGLNEEYLSIYKRMKSSLESIKLNQKEYNKEIIKREE